VTDSLLRLTWQCVDACGGASPPPLPPLAPSAPAAPQPQHAPQQPKGELDFLADSMGGQQQQQGASGGFEPGAFDNGGAGFSGQQPQHPQQQPGPWGAPPPYGGYPGYTPQMTGYAPGYAPQMTGYGYAPQMTGAPQSMALVPVGAWQWGLLCWVNAEVF
jgi:hypothetical protein